MKGPSFMCTKRLACFLVPPVSTQERGETNFFLEGKKISKLGLELEDLATSVQVSLTRGMGVWKESGSELLCR